MSIEIFTHAKSNQKSEAKKLALVTCYDHWSALILEQSSVDAILVGDSAAMVMHGHSTTVPATIEMLKPHVAAVCKGAPSKFVIADLPFMSFRTDLTSCVLAVRELMQAGAQAVKLEGCKGNEALIRHLVESGVPVMGHIGLTPQFVHQFGGFKVQGKNKEAEEHLMQEALQLQQWGCFALVIECVPMLLAKNISKELRIPSIGIGAGPHCDGQILVLQDLLGVSNRNSPRFVRRYLDGFSLIKAAVDQYAKDVREQSFPQQDESYVGSSEKTNLQEKL